MAVFMILFESAIRQIYSDLNADRFVLANGRYGVMSVRSWQEIIVAGASSAAPRAMICW